MTDRRIFYLDQKPDSKTKFLIRCEPDNFRINSTRGSLNVICARLMGMTYVQYLLLCRDVCGATIIGRNSMYPYPIFENNNTTKKLVACLNARANRILTECAAAEE